MGWNVIEGVVAIGAGIIAGSVALVADAAETWVCSYLSLALLAGVGLHELFGWWWADPVGALAMLRSSSGKAGKPSARPASATTTRTWAWPDTARSQRRGLTLKPAARSTVPTMSLTVSTLGAEVGLSAATVRYYERLGLLPSRNGPRPATANTSRTRSSGCGSSRAPSGSACGYGRSGSCWPSATRACAPAGTARPCCAPALLRSTPRSPNSKRSGPSWPGWSSGIRPRPAMTRPQHPAGVRPPLLRRGGDGYGLLVLRLPLPGVAVLVLRLPVPGVPTLRCR